MSQIREFETIILSGEGGKYIQSPYNLVNSATCTGSGFSSGCLKIAAWHSYSVEPREKKISFVIISIFAFSHRINLWIA